MSESKEKIIKIADSVKNLLIAKNEAYGDSALKPAKIFARGSAIDNLCSRIDDKLMRIKNGGITEMTEDTITDLIGYLILLKIAIADEQEGSDCNDLRDTIQKPKSSLYPHWESTRTDSVG